MRLAYSCGLRHRVRRFRLIAWSIMVTVSLWLTLTSAAQTATPTPVYFATNLGTFPGGLWSSAYDINASGQITGVALTSMNEPHAFLWTDGVMQDLGTLGGPMSAGFAINSDGDVVGQSETATLQVHAFLYRDGVMHDLGTLGGFSESVARGINDAGQIVGYSRTTSGDTHAFVYVDGIMTDLGTIAGPTSYGYAINNAGQAVGRTTIGDQALPFHAFLYEGESMRDLGSLGGSSLALSISDTGHVAGSFWLEGSSGPEHAFLYRDGSMTDLGTLGGVRSYAEHVNVHDQVVGRSATAEGGWVPFIWTAGVMHKLVDLIDPDSHLIDFDPISIDDTGRIVGSGELGAPTQDRAFLLTPVPPTAVITLLLNPTEISGGFGVTGTIRLSTPAGPEGAEVTLSSTEGASVPYSVLVAPNESEATFEIDTLGVSSAKNVTIKAERLGFHKTAGLTVHPLIASWKFQPSPVAGCKPSTGTLSLRGPAPAGGLYINLASSSSTVTVPATLLVKAGSRTGKFRATTTPVASLESVTLTASYREGIKNTTLPVRPIGARQVGLSPNPVAGGNPVAGLVTLECPAAPGDISVALSSSRPSIAQPSATSITIPFGSLGGAFEVATAPILTTTNASIRATANGVSKVKKLTLTP
jgi:probable HAF family extracellular repeat protein